MTTSEERIRHYLNKYQNPETTKREILKTCRAFDGLYVKCEPFEFSNGMKKDLVNLSGTIPVNFKNRSYNIPICIWIMDTHPLNAPICYVTPTPDMSVKVSMHVDHTGKIYMPYLHTWSENSSLIALINLMITTFGSNPPVFTKAKSGTASPPYPTQAYAPQQAGAYPPSTPYPPYPVQSAGTPYPQMQHGQYNPVSSQSAYYPTPSTYPQSSPYTPYPLVPPTQTSPASAAGNTGTITDEHIRASLMSAIEDKLRRKVNEQLSLCRDELQILRQQELELTDKKTEMERQFENLNREKSDVEKSIQDLKNQEIEIEKVLKNLSGDDPIDLDDTVLPATPLHKQILNTYCEDLALDDTIYYVAEGLMKNVIDLDTFIKQLRSLSRRQFMIRALADKCKAKAGIHIY